MKYISFYDHSPLLLVQEGQLSVIGESMCTKYWLTAYILPRKILSMLIDGLYMILIVLTGQ